MTPPAKKKASAIDIPLWTIRAVFLASAVGLGAYLARLAEAPGLEFLWMVGALLFAILVIAIDGLAIARSPINVVSAMAFGLLIGFITAQLFVGIVSLMADFTGTKGLELLNGIRLAVTLLFCYLGPAYLLRTKDDFRFIVPYVEFQRQGKGLRPLVVDTSAIIDGRIVDLAQSGLFDSEFIVPRYVVEELQRIADSNDKNRRERGRRGLDKLKTLQGIADVELSGGGYSEEEVDRRLIELTKTRGGKLVTVDFNLQKVCDLEGVQVLNLNEIAAGMRAPFVSGDQVAVKIVKKGEGAEQGVGYLGDGTMVVVEGARKLKGEQIVAVVTSTIQSSAGRMVFARYDAPAPAPTEAADPTSTEESRAEQGAA